jgi:hypothetical protein
VSVRVSPPGRACSGTTNPSGAGCALIECGYQRLDFAEFYHRSRDDCLRTVLISVGDQDTAQELVAEAFARTCASWRTVSRHPASTVAKFWDMPRDVADLPWYRSANANIFPTTETDAGALTGGSLSSFYMGPFARMLMGLHLDLSSMVLTERYIDYGQIGLWAIARWSVRTSHPETFVRTRGVITT